MERADGGRQSRRPANLAALTVDAAMMLVDQCLADAGSCASCTREQVQAAFEYLTSARVGIAVWIDDSRESIVIVQRPAAAP